MKLPESALYVLLFLRALPILAQNEIKQIESIRSLYQDTNAKIAQMQKDPSVASIYSIELTVNHGEAQYPAIGTFKEVTRFYYTFGDREKNPYPDRLLKIEVTTTRAARLESAEFLFDANGELVFCFEKHETEMRYYFARGKIIRMQRESTRLNPADASESKSIQSVQARARRLVEIFKRAL
ncbi:MAG: hypothetical protein K8S54_10125 [Spirochaetia bacterium]|nr:hypothetical protein [Spirochaetia bacterium]